MEAMRYLKHQVRRYPRLTAWLQPPVVGLVVGLRRLRMARWYGASLLGPDAMSPWIERRLTAATPTAIGKLGTLELELLVHACRGDRIEVAHIPSQLRRQAFVNVGLFPDDDGALQAALRCIRDALAHMDAMAVYAMAGERSLLESFAPRLQAKGPTGALEPWNASTPWSAALRGKRVLVVHPFVDTIAAQYRDARQALWPGRPELLPEFGELLTLRMPLSAALAPPQESTWSERLVRMCEEMERLRFDVALIGAGGMSLPLSVHAKGLGACAVHLGGATQLLFGIRGKRWDGSKEFSPYINDAWVRPGQRETPKGVQQVENGCYW